MRFAAFVAALVCSCTGHAADPDISMLARIPETANMVSVVNVQGTLASPLAVKQEWAQKLQAGADAGMILLPSGTTNMVTAGSFNLDDRTTGWHIGFLRTTRLVSLNDVSAREAGTMDAIDRQNVVRSPRNVFFTLLDGNTLGVFAPAHRQKLAWWINRVEPRSKPQLSPFLTQVVANRGQAQVFAALDMTNALDPGSVRRALTLSQAARTAGNLDSLAGFVAGVRGLAFTATITDKIEGQLRVEFSGNCLTRGPFLRPFVLEVLAMEGFHFDEITDWQASLSQPAITLSGPLSVQSLRRILSLVEMPGVANESPGGDQPNPVASLNYFRAVTSIIDELRPLQNQNFNRFAGWNDSFARKIDQLPVRGVDPAVLDWGYKTADRLRSIANSLRGVPIQTAALEGSAQVSLGSVYTGGGWRGRGTSVFLDTNFGQIQAQQQQVIAEDAKNRDWMWQQIDTSTAAVRRQMTEKFNTPF